MRKTLHISILFIAVFAICNSAVAAGVTIATAQTTAVNFYSLTAKNLQGRVVATLKHTKTEADGTVDFYVFDLSPGKGFVIVSADDQMKPIIGYSLESNFNTNTNGRAVETWMANAGAHIYKGIQQHTIANAQIKGQWTSYLQGTKPANAKSLGAGVGPLLTTTWDQEPFYNQLCPYNSNDHQRTLTGCAATAMAQIMKFWNYPTIGTGTYAYNHAPPTCSYNYGSQNVNFGNTTYNWAAMPNSIDTTNISIATLMYHCGVAVTMNYGDDNQGGSGSFVLRSQTTTWKHSVEMALATYFGYNPNTLKGVYESNYSSADWVSLMESELNAGRPIQYLGTDLDHGGHTWVCDGYDENDMLHMNWGWGGLDNGYYSVSALSADGYNFSSNEAALIGIEPMSDLTVTASASLSTICSGGKTTLSAQGPANVTYLWTPSTGLSCSTCAITTASPTSTTTYTVTIDSAGMSASAPVTINIGTGNVSISMINITNSTGIGTANGSVNVNVAGGTPAYTYVWSNDAGGATISNLAAGTYKVTITDALGCSTSAMANVTQPDSSMVGSNGQADSSLNVHTGHGGHPAETPNQSRAALTNKGSAIYVQQSAVITLQGDFVNMASGSSKVYNDGIIEVQGNFENDSSAVFTTGTNSSSTDRAVKFVGSGTQTITGNMSTPGQSSFYNVVIDQAAASDTVEMQTPVVVQGSIIFGTANTTSTYNPSGTYTNNNQKGILKTFNNSLGEFLLDLQNGSPDAIAGYPVLEMGLAPSTGFILTSGDRGSSAGGLQRKISSATSYLFPIGTPDKGFNGIRLNFSQIPGNGSVKAKFCSGSSNPDHTVGSISQYCDGCAQGYVSGEGFSKYFANNECNHGAPQWVSFGKTLANHGYWSLASTNTGYEYDLEVFANSYGYLDPYNSTRVLKHEAGYGVDPSGAAVDWRPEIESLCANATDLLTYTKNAGCYTGGGIPGGIYRDFSHFSIGSSGGSTALPVQLLYLTAEATGKHHILVSWATALEINNQGFFVMRSTDGVNFSDIGWVVGHDNSTVQQNYTFDDRPSQSTVYYYKLRQIDNNGKFTYSNIAEAKLQDQQSQDFSLYPNPTASDIFLVVRNPDSEVKVEVFDIKGQLVYDNIFTIENTGSEQTLTIHATQQMTLGTYILTATTNGEKFSAKVILQ